MLSSKSLKLVDEFTYLGCNITLSESDVNVYQVKPWTAVDSLSIFPIKLNVISSKLCLYKYKRMDAPPGI